MHPPLSRWSGYSIWPGYTTPQGKRPKLNRKIQNLSDYVCKPIGVKGHSIGFIKACIHVILRPGHNGGPENAEFCVLKEFKAGSVYEKIFFDDDIKRCFQGS